jgi:hypothetical protein
MLESNYKIYHYITQRFIPIFILDRSLGGNCGIYLAPKDGCVIVCWPDGCVIVCWPKPVTIIIPKLANPKPYYFFSITVFFNILKFLSLDLLTVLVID